MDWDKLAGIACLQGSLRIASGIDLPNFDISLRSIDGDIDIQPGPFTYVSAEVYVFPVLEHVGGTVRLGAGEVHFAKLESVDNLVFSNRTADGTFPALRQVRETLLVSGSFDVVRLRMPVLEKVGTLAVTGNENLQAIAGFPALREVRHFELSGNPKLEWVVLPALSEAGTFSVRANGALAELDARALENVGALRYTGNGPLAALTFPKLAHAESLGIEQNSGLTELRFPALERVTSNIELGENPILRRVEMPILRGARGELPGVPDVPSTRLEIWASPALETLAAPKLDALDDLTMGEVGLQVLDGFPELRRASVQLTRMPALTRVAFPALELVGTLTLERNPVLRSISTPKLAGIYVCNIGGNPELVGFEEPPPLTDSMQLRMSNNPKWGSMEAFSKLSAFSILVLIRMPSVTGLEPVLDHLEFLGHLVLEQLPGLGRIRAAKLKRIESGSVGGNANLTALELPALEHVRTTLTVAGNPKLPECHVDAIRRQLVAAPTWENQVSSQANDTSVTCP